MGKAIRKLWAKPSKSYGESCGESYQKANKNYKKLWEKLSKCYGQKYQKAIGETMGEAIKGYQTYEIYEKAITISQL